MNSMTSRMPIIAARMDVLRASSPRVADTVSTFCWVRTRGRAPDWIWAAMVRARSSEPMPLMTPDPFGMADWTVGLMSISLSR